MFWQPSRAQQRNMLILDKSRMLSGDYIKHRYSARHFIAKDKPNQKRNDLGAKNKSKSKSNCIFVGFVNFFQESQFKRTTGDTEDTERLNFYCRIAMGERQQSMLNSVSFLKS